MAEQLVLLTSDKEVMGLNAATGRAHIMTLWCFIVQNLSLSPLWYDFNNDERAVRSWYDLDNVERDVWSWFDLNNVERDVWSGYDK